MNVFSISVFVKKESMHNFNMLKLFIKIATQSKQSKMASEQGGQGSQQFTQAPVVHICVTLRTTLINFVINIFTLLAFIQSVEYFSMHLFSSVVFLYFFIYGLPCSFTNTTSCLLVLLSSVSYETILQSICS